MAELQALPQVMQQRVMKGTVATGAAVIRREIAMRAPEYSGDVAEGHPPPGTLKRAIYQARVPELCTATREVWMVGVRTGKRTGRGKANKHDAYYARWVEYGHYTRGAKGQNRATRRAIRSGTQFAAKAYFVLPRPFFRPGFEAKKDDALKAMQQYINDNLALANSAFRYIKAQASVRTAAPLELA